MWADPCKDPQRRWANSLRRALRRWFQREHLPLEAAAGFWCVHVRRKFEEGGPYIQIRPSFVVARRGSDEYQPRLHLSLQIGGVSDFLSVDSHSRRSRERMLHWIAQAFWRPTCEVRVPRKPPSLLSMCFMRLDTVEVAAVRAIMAT